MGFQRVETEKPWGTRGTNIEIQNPYGLQALLAGGQTGDKPGTVGDKILLIENNQLDPLSPMSPTFSNMGDGYRPRFYWLSPVSPMSPSKTTGPTPSFENLKTATALYLLGEALFPPVQNMQKEVVYD